VDSLTNVVIYPLVALLLVALLFMHISLRSKASLASLLSLSLLVAWESLARWAFYLYVDMASKPGTTSPYEHPTFESVNGIVDFTLIVVFVLSFFLSAISIPAKTSDQPQSLLSGVPTSSLWLRALVALALSLFCALW
jgi:hypothetical protein